MIYLCDPFTKFIMSTNYKKDDQLFQLIDKEEKRQLEGIELIASENFVSKDVMSAMGSVLTNKYAEGTAGEEILWWM